MKKIILRITVAALSAGAFFAINARAADDLALRTKQTIADFQSADPGLRSFMNNAAGYAVFPTVDKGGLVIGGAHGDGLLFQNGVIVGRTSLTQASIGAQAGGEKFSQIIVFESPAALASFKNGKFELGADINAVAISQSVSKTAPLTYTRGLAVFTMQQNGLMAEAAVSGQKFSFQAFTPAAQPLVPTGR